MRALSPTKTALIGAALIAFAGAPVFAQSVGSTTNDAAGDTYRGKPGQASAMDRATVGLTAAAQVNPETPRGVSTAVSATSSAAAQTPEGHSSDAAQTLNPTTANGAPPLPPTAATGRAINANATAAEMTIPTNWKGSPQGWAAHVSACSKRFKSYNAATDSYTGSRGRTMMCTLAVAN